ncbi:MAG: hypothetical protein RR324_00510 [Cellulosilyticaceae bacterium]
MGNDVFGEVPVALIAIIFIKIKDLAIKSNDIENVIKNFYNKNG